MDYLVRLICSRLKQQCRLSEGLNTEYLPKGWINPVDLLVLTTTNQLLFKQKLYFSFFYETTYLDEEVNCIEPTPSIRNPWLNYLTSAMAQ
jgi:hypothetical protein